MPAYTRDQLTTQLKVGLEVHVELSTRSKMWTDAPNVAHPDFYDAGPNTLVDPVVVGMPGTLPVINERAVELSVMVGLALGCAIASRCKWDRKSYYYPDLPKNYQISQYDQPICGEGSVTFDVPGAGAKTVRITRAHLEEDAGKLMHELPGGGFCDGSLVDLNRAGTPLLEIVTEPDFATADEVIAFSQWLRETCRNLGVTEGVMQKGHMRFEPNINVLITTPDGETVATPVVEVKNLNSFKAVHGAITYEAGEQVERWLKDGKTMGARAKSTRGWDDVNLVTTPQREKEDADQYRYFPDPDLVEVAIDADWLARIRAEMPESVGDKRARYLGAFGLNEKIAEQLLGEPGVTRYFDAVVERGVDPKRAAAFLLNTAAKLANERGGRLDELGIDARQTADVIALIDGGQVGSNSADALLAACAESNDNAATLAERHELLQVSDDGALDGWIDTVVTDPKLAGAVQDIRDGKDKAVGALMGRVMQLSKGKANPGVVRERLFAKLRG